MFRIHARYRVALLSVAVMLCIYAAGCRHTHGTMDFVDPDAPNEARRVPQNPYTIGPPDVLLINAGNLVPQPPYRIGALDALAIQASFGPKKLPLLENDPLTGVYAVGPDGKVELPTAYGSIAVVGMTLDEARKTVEAHLLRRFKGPLNVSVDLAQSNQALQQIRGEHLVRPDGTVGLGVYGNVFVDGMTLDQAKGVSKSICLATSSIPRSPSMSQASTAKCFTSSRMAPRGATSVSPPHHGQRNRPRRHCPCQRLDTRLVQKPHLAGTPRPGHRRIGT